MPVLHRATLRTPSPRTLHTSTERLCSPGVVRHKLIKKVASATVCACLVSQASRTPNVAELLPHRNPYGKIVRLFSGFSQRLFVVGEAAQATNWVTAPKTLREGCASSRLDYSFPDHHFIFLDGYGERVSLLGRFSPCQRYALAMSQKITA